MRGILLLLAFAFTNAQASVDFKNAEFGLKLGSDWTRTILIGAEHLYFSSKTAQVSIKADSLRPKVRPENFRKIAQALIERWIKKENEDNKSGWVTISEQAVTKFGDGVRATYSGRDGTQRSFKWLGFIKEGKFVYLYFETPTPNEHRLESVVAEVLEGFTY
jgi:hypothetical protein